jgi:hypothetical protein
LPDLWQSECIRCRGHQGIVMPEEEEEEEEDVDDDDDDDE